MTSPVPRGTPAVSTKYKLILVTCGLLLAWVLYLNFSYYQQKQLPTAQEYEPTHAPHAPPIKAEDPHFYEYFHTSFRYLRNASKSNYLPPINCGSGWQEEYGELHRRALREGGKVLVSIAVEGGIADNLSGLMSEFYLALLSKRAFQIYDYGYLPKYNPAFDHVYFNWSNPGYPDILTNNLKYTYKGERGYQGERDYPPEVNTSENWPIYQMNDFHRDKEETFLRTNISSQFPKDKTHVKNVFMVSNRGMTYRLAKNNAYHNEYFRNLSIRPEYMFGCAFRALFKPTPALVRRSQEFLSILTDPSKLKIGIMVRVGDISFVDNHMSDRDYKIRANEAFRCAEQIERTVRRSYNITKPILWYLLSDHLDFRRRAKIEYKDKILTDVETNFIHPDCMAHDADRCSLSMTDVAMMQAASQLITFAWTDYQVVTRGSGFGRVGAVLAAQVNNTLYSLPRENRAPCDENHADSWEKISTDWAGI